MDLDKQNSILLIKLESLQRQVDIYESMQKEIYADFKQELSNYLYNNFSEQERDAFTEMFYGPPNTPSVEKKKNISEQESRHIKNIFKEIAKKTHPDKHPGDGEKEALFKKAQLASSTGDLSSLKLMAKELDIELPEVTKLDIEILQKKISTLEAKLENYPKTFPWMWNENNREEKYILEFIKRATKDGIRT